MSTCHFVPTLVRLLECVSTQELPCRALNSSAATPRQSEHQGFVSEGHSFAASAVLILTARCRQHHPQPAANPPPSISVRVISSSPARGGGPQRGDDVKVGSGVKTAPPSKSDFSYKSINTIDRSMQFPAGKSSLAVELLCCTGWDTGDQCRRSATFGMRSHSTLPKTGSAIP